MAWTDLRTKTTIFSEQVMQNFEALGDGTRTLTALNVTGTTVLNGALSVTGLITGSNKLGIRTTPASNVISDLVSDTAGSWAIAARNTGTNGNLLILAAGSDADTSTTNLTGPRVQIQNTATITGNYSQIDFLEANGNSVAGVIGAITTHHATTPQGYLQMYVRNSTQYLFPFKIDISGTVSMPQVYSHDMNGETTRDLYINDSGELGYLSSAKKYKTKIEDMENTGWLYDLRPVNFEYRKKTSRGELLNEGTGQKEYGLIADEVVKINDLFVFKQNSEVEGVYYRKLISVIINEMQKLNERIKELENKIK